MKFKTLFIIIVNFLVIQIHFPIFSYNSELQSAYTRAFNNSITTQPTIDKANIESEITRIELSKMISNYAINVLKKDPDKSKECKFSDIREILDNQYDNWVSKACQLWLMGQWITKFRPYDKVTRAEFWTVLSRILYWNTFEWWIPYYSNHLKVLQEKWIMKIILNPEANEIRWYVMLMLMRSSTEYLDSNSLIAIDEKIDNETWLPYCKMITLKNKWEEVIIDDVVKNCKIITWIADNLWLEWYPFWGNWLSIFENWILDNRWSENNDTVCIEKWWWEVRNPDSSYNNFISFLNRHKIKEKGLLSYAYNSQPPLDYHCVDYKLCRSLFNSSSWWYYDKHYYLFWIRYNNKYDNDNYDYYYVIDDTIYKSWRDKYIEWTDIAVEWPWILNEIKNEKIIVSKLIENILRNDSNYSDYKIATCEINI